MANSKSLKRALLTSALAIVLCVTMLIGTTFAWFTDTASTGVNRIVSGNLDIELEYKNKGMEAFKAADKNTPVFDQNALWEPGHVEYVVLRLSNAGSLALKYQLGINIAAETGSTNVNGDTFKLSDYIRFAVLDDDQSGLSRDALVAAADGKDAVLNTGYTANGHLLAGETDSEKIVTLVVWMPTTVGNEANHKTDEEAPSVKLGINVAATQYTYEEDSFDDQYDKDAPYPVIASISELQGKLRLADIPTVSADSTKHVPVEVTIGDADTEDIHYSEHLTGYTGKGILMGSTALNKYAAAPAEAGAYTFIFKDGTVAEDVTGYSSIDGATTNSMYMLLPGNSDVVFENMTFNGVVSFDIQKYTSPWSHLNSIRFKNCTFNGIIVGTCPASDVTFEGCTFNNYTNTEYANNSNPIWWRADYEGQGSNATYIKNFTFVNNTVTSTRPVKIERIGRDGCNPVFTFKNNTFDIRPQAGDTETRNMAINIGQWDDNSKFTLIDEGNTISADTAALYTAALSSGSNQYKAVSGNKVLDGNGNNKTITAMVWKTTTGETFEMKTID